jgi:hypothetical protein
MESVEARINAIKRDYFKNIFDEDFVNDSFEFLEKIDFYKNEKYEKFRLDHIFTIFSELYQKLPKKVGIDNIEEVIQKKISIKVNEYEEILMKEQQIENQRKIEEERMLNHLNELAEKENLADLFAILNKNENLKHKFYKTKNEKIYKYEENILNYFLSEISNNTGFKQIKNKHLNMSYKLESNKTITLRFEREFDLPFIHFLSLVYETAYYPKWFPFCSHTETLKQPDKAKKLIYMVSSFPMISDRDFLVYGFGVNRLKDNRSILILVKSVEDNTGLYSEYVKQKENKKFVRAVIHIFGYELTLINRNKFICKGLVNVDPKINFIPQSMINFVGKKVIIVNLVCRKSVQ